MTVRHAGVDERNEFCIMHHEESWRKALKVLYQKLGAVKAKSIRPIKISKRLLCPIPVREYVPIKPHCTVERLLWCIPPLGQSVSPCAVIDL